MTGKPLGESSGITIGLAAGVVIAGFWAGLTIGGFEKEITHVKLDQAKAEVSIDDLQQTAGNHETRLTTVEQRGGDRVAAK